VDFKGKFYELAKNAAIEAALKDFAYFHARYFASAAEGGPIQGLSEFHLQWVRLAESEKRLLLLAPRAHAKTTVISIEYVVYLLCKWRWALRKNPNLPGPRIGILSDTEGQAEDILRAIKRHLEPDSRNDKITHDFGRWKPESPLKWTNLSIIVDGWHAPNEKDVTVYAGGYESAWLGKRFDVLIVDDLPNLKRNSASENARAILVNWFREVLTNCLEAQSKLLYVATMQHHQDLTNTIIQDERERRRTGDPVWTIRRYKAILRPPSRVSAPKVLWPEHFSYEELLNRRREIGTASFEKQYQNVAVNEDLLVFRVGWLRNRCIDRAHSIGRVERGWGVYMGVDPAIGESHLSSFFSLVVLGYDKDRKRLYLIDYVKDKIPATRQEKLIAEYYEKYSVLQCRIESNAYQKALAQTLREKYPTLRIQDQFTGRNKIDPEMGITSLLAPVVENGLLRLPYSTPESVRKSEQFIDELALWPTRNADIVMALWIAASAALESTRMAQSRGGEWGTTVKNPLYQKQSSVELTEEGYPRDWFKVRELDKTRGVALPRGIGR
jgi:phage terminase large subunit-like protein